MTGLSPLAISMGEPAGLGPDLILRLYSERAAHNLPPFIIFGHLGFLRARAERLGLAIRFSACDLAEAPVAFTETLPVLDLPGEVPDTPGVTDASAAPLVLEAIAAAVRACQSGACRAIVTSPIHKGALYGAGFAYPGHTEYLAALCEAEGATPRPVMMLAYEGLRTVPATIHVPLASVAPLITPHLLLETARITAHDLRTRFRIPEPRLALCGLNPHAGEGGSIGVEDRDIILPVVETLRSEGLAVDGPLPADTLFYPPHWKRYDAVIAMYHDQALIPIKTVAFESAVNVTLGLPIVRTSPDHGTAFDLAGTGRGSTASLLAAIRLADSMSQ